MMATAVGNCLPSIPVTRCKALPAQPQETARGLRVVEPPGNVFPFNPALDARSQATPDPLPSP